MTKHSKTEIYSIFGQIDAVAAQTMVDDGKATKIEQDMIPPSALFDEATGRKAFFALIIGRDQLPELERRTKALYA
jgi:hypothetical protein